MTTISEKKFWELFNYYLMIYNDEASAESAVLSEYKVKWD